jgi:predicted acetyltransferase
MPAVALMPSVEYQHAFLAMLADFDAHDTHNAEFYAPAKSDFRAYVQSLLDEERGLSLREGRVPCTHRWLVTARGAVVGVTRLRHNISTPFLSESAGHIGYDVAPSYRGRGYGHAALRVALGEAGAIGLQRALLFAGANNAPCRSMTERQGGVLESIAFSEFWGEQLCRYWINVPQQG